MLNKEIIAVCSQIHTKHINTLCGQNVGLLNVRMELHIVTTGLIIGKFTLAILLPFKRKEEPGLHIKIQSVPRSKHTPSQL